MNYVVAVDVGGTEIKSARVEAASSTLTISKTYELFSGKTLLKPIQDYLDSSLTFQRKPRLEIAHYKSQAGTIGCAMLAFDLVKGGK